MTILADILRHPVPSPDTQAHSHYLGNQIFISAQDYSIFAGGLRAAASWVGLRQEIFFAFVNQRSVVPNLSRSGMDRSFSDAEDYTWANRIVFHCAEMLRYCFDETRSDAVTYEELLQYSDDWMEYKPRCFSPMFYEGPQDGEALPEIWMMNDAVATGMQHYYLGRILLRAHNPKEPRLGLAGQVSKQKMDEDIRSYVRSICGIAVSNPNAPPNMA
jgi:hypothetical protein